MRDGFSVNPFEFCLIASRLLRILVGSPDHEYQVAADSAVAFRVSRAGHRSDEPYCSTWPAQRSNPKAGSDRSKRVDNYHPRPLPVWNPLWTPDFAPLAGKPFERYETRRLLGDHLVK